MLFDSTKHKFDLPHGAKCNSHQSDKLNNSIPHPSTMQAITKTLYNAKAGSGKHGTYAPTYKEIKKRIPLHKQYGA
jgi:hypothetical protein